MSYEHILYDVKDHILTLTLNRPDKLNSFTGTMGSEIIDAFDKADRDDDVRVIIVTGAGRGFCAGADLSSGANAFDRDSRPDRKSVPKLANGEPDWSHDAVRDGGGRVTLRIYECLKPVIAAVNGPAVGIGVTMQLPMDIRIASEAARFGFVFSRRGIVPEAASSYFLPRIVGISQALEWCYSGRVFSAQEALAGRLVSKVVPPDQLLPTARAIAQEIVENPADDVEDARRRSSDGGAQDRQPRHLCTRAIVRRQGRRGVVPRKAPAAIHQQGFAGHAVLFPVVGRTALQVRELAYSPAGSLAQLVRATAL
jgi:enoyl-CoA hydratase/carnithine racemase